MAEHLDIRTWPERLLELVSAIAGPAGMAARAEFWQLLNLVLVQRMRLHIRRYGPVDIDRLHDLAAEKALDLVQRLDSGQWKPREASAGELVAFVSTVARNALVDERRRERRRDEAIEEQRSVMPDGTHTGDGSPEESVDRQRFVTRMVACAGALRPPHRTVWLLRVLYDLPSKLIASHPEVGLQPGNVDVILNRCRAQIHACMTRAGFDPRELPPGTFVELWEQFRAAAPALEVITPRSLEGGES